MIIDVSFKQTGFKKESSLMTKYAITAATGNLGQAAVKELNKLVGADNVVVIARNEEKAAKLFPNNEVRRGDYEDVESMLLKALTASSLFLHNPVARSAVLKSIKTL